MKLMKNKLLIFFMTFVLSFVCILSVVCPINVRADSSGNNSADVVNDLQKDSTFSVQDYPIMDLDHFTEINTDNDKTNDQLFVELITIAESSNKELFLYVYQPTNDELDLKVESISMSTEESEDGQGLKLSNYDLELISTYSVFDKYLVKDFTVSNDLYRYYNIVTLRHEYNPYFGDVPTGGDESNYEVAVDCGQQWCVYHKNNSLVYEMATFETVEININLWGKARYNSVFQFKELCGVYDKCDIWFIAFDFDEYDVKQIYDADLTYKIKKVEEWQYGTPPSNPWSEDIKVTLKGSDIAVYETTGPLSSKKYTWNRISTASSFLENVKDQGASVSSDYEKKLKESEWVFVFLETEYRQTLGTGVNSYYSLLSDITVLRIHFKDAKDNVYNLGVVADRGTPVGPPGIEKGDDTEEDDWWKKIIYLILIILLVLVLLQTGILPLIGKAVVFVISAPFVFIKWLIDKLKGG